jgi:hypothetical protein
MKWAALILWIITALGGFTLLGIWLRRGGLDQADQPGRRIRPALIFSHMGLAATGLVLWIIYVAGAGKGLAWVAFVLLLLVASLGFGMLALWLQRRQTQTVAVAGAPGGASGDGGVPAEQHFPPAIVVVHGLVAATTLVLVFLAAVS